MPKGVISRDLDDRLYEQAMFGDVSSNSLGRPEVVGGLVADYCMMVRELLVKRAQGTITTAQAMSEFGSLRDHMANVFAGKDPQFPAIQGWPEQLNTKLRVELGTYWDEHRAENEDNPFKVFFAWMLWAVSDSMAKAKGDQDFEAMLLSFHTGPAIKMLLGTDETI